MPSDILDVFISFLSHHYTRKIKWLRTKRWILNINSILIKFNRFFSAPWSLTRDTQIHLWRGEFSSKRQREKMCHHWEEEKNLSEKYVSPRSINSYTKHWKDVDRDGGQEAVGKDEEAVQLERRADRVSNTLEICLGSLPLLLRFRWLEKPAMIRLCTRSFYDYIGQYSNYILILISQECKNKCWKNNSNFQLTGTMKEFHSSYFVQAKMKYGYFIQVLNKISEYRLLRIH